MTLRIAVTLIHLAAMVCWARADILWGVNGHPFTAYPGISYSQQLDYVADLGMRSYRVNIVDADVASDLAVLVKQARMRGIDILPVITPGNVDLANDSTEGLYRKAFDLAAALASRFKDEIRVWELGNEMENFAIIQPCELRDDGTKYPCEWGPAGGVGPLDYYGPRWAKVSAVLKGLSDGVVSVDPSLQKAMGTAGWGHLGAFERMKRDGIQWDITVWHAYGQDTEWAFEVLSEYGRPIWLTEFNNPYGSQRSEEQQAQNLERTIKRLRELKARYKLEAAFIYELLDEPYWAPDFEAHMGLVRVVATSDGGWAVGEPKSAYGVVKTAINGRPPLPEPQRECTLADLGADGSLAVRQLNYSSCLVLGRLADQARLTQWVAPLERGDASIFDILLDMARSEEFETRHATFGLTNPAYVSFLYKLLLIREVDPHGLASYAGELSSGAMTRAGVALAIMTSSEFEQRHPILSKKSVRSEAAKGTSPG